MRSFAALPVLAAAFSFFSSAFAENIATEMATVVRINLNDFICVLPFGFSF